MARVPAPTPGLQEDIQRLVNAGHTVVVADLRGMGSLAPGKAAAKAGYFGKDVKEAFLGIHLNRPLLGQRVYDLLSFVEFCARQKGTVEVVAVGSAGPIALHAAALDKRIAKLTVENALLSWQSVVATPVSVNQLTNVVPGALRVYDLPDLAALIAPRPLTIRAAVDARGEPVSRAALESTYSGCREQYARRNALHRLVLETGQK